MPNAPTTKTHGWRFLLLSNYFNIFGYSLFTPLYGLFVLHIGGTAWHMSSVWAVYTVTMGITMLTLGRYSYTIADPRRIVISGYCALVIGALLFLWVSSVWQLYLVQIINAVAVGLMTPAWKALYAKGEDRGRELQEWALVDGGDQLLIAFAALLGGAIITLFGFPAIFIGMAFFEGIGALIAFRLPRTITDR